ncbi:MAG TPA: SufD family Fe-S cluster assembly protein [Candidatus Ornithomonoglobus merdipullorum]|uniref:SufD family Fe-S cluster assembly protein n=1 Tax=Candidatus Ornithomonoglobus merdipullorum TaxID=2840895 RepID=A0A9D1MA58_9FIRM|nr:SufD family Fe-S cluster assembly protein [Candidatus Ornithomonoglobus merdipullorum]
MNEITRELLKAVSDYDDGGYKDAYSIRENGCCVERRSTENIIIDSKKDAPGLEIHIKPGTKGERLSIPACVTHGDIDDLVYNDFYVGEGADVLIIAGCGVHVSTGEPARHNGIHRFFIGKNAHVIYRENHVGTGRGKGIKTIDPVTDVILEDGAEFEMDSLQLGGVDRTVRKTSATVGKDAKLIIRERILTDGEQQAITDFEVEMNGENSSVNLISRSVAKGKSHQAYRSKIVGNAPCAGHSECDAIIADEGKVDAAPELSANHEDAALIHEAAIGKIAGDQIIKLRTLGLTEEEAEAKIVAGFLK